MHQWFYRACDDFTGVCLAPQTGSSGKAILEIGKKFGLHEKIELLGFIPASFFSILHRMFGRTCS
jgi:hypothetical protein